MALTFASSKRLMLGILALCVLALSGCGQRGPLEAPTSNTNAQTQPLDVDQAQGQQIEPVPTKAPDDRFVLDGLL